MGVTSGAVFALRPPETKVCSAFYKLCSVSLQDNFGFDLPAVEAATKKHEAIETDIAAYEERVQAVVAVARELEAENYHDIKRITARKDNVIRLWEYLLELLRARRQRLEMNLGLQKIFQEMLYIMDWMDEMKVRLDWKEAGAGPGRPLSSGTHLRTPSIGRAPGPTAHSAELQKDHVTHREAASSRVSEDVPCEKAVRKSRFLAGGCCDLGLVCMCSTVGRPSDCSAF